MTNIHWQEILKIINGETPSSPLAGFIIDSPWLPGWYGITGLQYYSSGRHWFNSNLKAIQTFPEIVFLPGFWSEYGMCSEPSAFGAKMVFTEYNLPHADRILTDISEAGSLQEPNPKTDGLLPFILQRLVDYHPEIQQAGHEIRFAVARGPLNIASFLMGTTELMMAMIMDPENTHRLLEIITRFSVNWIQLQKETFNTIEGILVLDDIVGFIGENELREFATPYIKRIFTSFESKVNFFHNDAQGLICAPYLYEMGVNLFNFSFEHSLKDMRELAGTDITLLGNLPPRDVMAAGTPEQVYEETRKMYNSIDDKSRIIWSVGGGMPQGVSSENIRAFLSALSALST